jgi:serine/threonine protein kinase
MAYYDVSDFDRVVLGKKLGAGSFGSVFVGLLPSGRFVAVKELELQDDANANSEIAIHKTLSHPNIIRYLHSKTDLTSSPKKLLVYLEFVTGGSVTSLMKSLPEARLPLSVARVYARQLFMGLEYLHSNQVAHRDIKGDNLLISMDSGIAKLADFDQAKMMSGYGSIAVGRGATATLAGTPYWIAPEVITQEGGYDPFKADVWSAGCTVAEMITGKTPWIPVGNVMQIMNKLAMSQGWPDAIPRDPHALGSQDLFDFLELCFRRDASQRPHAAVLLCHPFLQV